MSMTNLIANVDNIQLTTVPGLSVLATDPYRPPKRKLSLYNVARTNNAKVNEAWYTERVITVRVGISQPTRALLEYSIDMLYGLLQGLEKDLVISQSIDLQGRPTVRRYNSTWSGVVPRVEGGSYIELDLLFTCSDNFGYETAYTVLINETGVTLANTENTDSVTTTGSAPTQAPLYRFKLNTFTGASSNIQIFNSTSNQILTIARTNWAVNDLVIVDAQAKSVTVNGSDVVFTGTFPELLSGAATITLRNSFSAVNYDWSVVYYRRFI